jgi:hypothetical protein
LQLITRLAHDRRDGPVGDVQTEDVKAAPAPDEEQILTVSTPGGLELRGGEC